VQVCEPDLIAFWAANLEDSVFFAQLCVSSNGILAVSFDWDARFGSPPVVYQKHELNRKMGAPVSPAKGKVNIKHILCAKSRLFPFLIKYAVQGKKLRS